jgi:hypothetical protein
VPVPVKTPKFMLAKREPDPVVIDQKSVLASGALSFIFGPLGWLYAAPVKDVAVGFFVFSAVATLATLMLPRCARSGSHDRCVGGLGAARDVLRAPVQQARSTHAAARREDRRVALIVRVNV